MSDNGVTFNDMLLNALGNQKAIDAIKAIVGPVQEPIKDTKFRRIEVANTTGDLWIRRVNSTVEVLAQINYPSAMVVGSELFSMPVGFRPKLKLDKIVSTGSAGMIFVEFRPNGMVVSSSQITFIRLQATFTVDSDFPSPIPGTLV